MPGDYTRFAFDPTKGFSGVLKQQGRVSLDADAIESVKIQDRRSRAQMLDVAGDGVVPEAESEGFKIQGSGGSLKIGAGRAYVDGILVECFGDLTLPGADPQLGNVPGRAPLDYEKQPFHYVPNFPPPSTASGLALVYLDVWQREVTAFEDGDLREPALGGPDTTTRVQAAWQVKVMTAAASDECDRVTSKWAAITAPTSTRLTAGTKPASTTAGPCVVNPAGGYTGLENRLYRVEVHRGGILGAEATFKWSRDNASLAAAVIEPIVRHGTTGSHIVVQSTGRDSWMRFETGDHIEFLDDDLEYSMRERDTGGVLAEITNVEHATGRITVDRDWSGLQVHALRHPRIRRWDRADVNEPLERPIKAGVPEDLEHGIRVTFAGDGTRLHAGDYWVFAARTATGRLDPVKNALPHGVRHHFAKLALLRGGEAGAVDCRKPFRTARPVATGCDCSVCVSAEEHNLGKLTIQEAIDRVADGGGTVCLEAGEYTLSDPLKIERARSVRLRGQGWHTVLVGARLTTSIMVSDCVGVTIERLTIRPRRAGVAPPFSVPALPTGLILPRGREGIGILLRNCADVTVADCAVTHVELPDRAAVLELDAAELERLARESGGIGIALDSLALGHKLTGNLLITAFGVGPVATGEGDERPSGDYLLAARLLVEDNLMLCKRGGVRLTGSAMMVDAARITRNTICGCWDKAAIEVIGTPGWRIGPGDSVDTASGLDVRDNVLRTGADGVISSVDGTRVIENRIQALGTAVTGRGIALVGVSEGQQIGHAEIRGNRITGIRGHGVALETTLGSCTVAGNRIERMLHHGVAVLANGGARLLTVTGNEITGRRPLNDETLRPESAYGVLAQKVKELVVDGNRVAAIGWPGAADRAGVMLVGVETARVSGNHISPVGPDTFLGTAAGVDVIPPWDAVTVADNHIARSADQSRLDSAFIAVRIGRPKPLIKKTVPVVAEPDRIVLVPVRVDFGHPASDPPQTGEALDLAPVLAEAASLGFGVFGGPPTIDFSKLGVIESGTHFQPMLAIGITAIELVPAWRGIVNIAGNDLDIQAASSSTESTSQPCVRVDRASATTLSHNHCSGNSVSLTTPVVRLEGTTVIASANHIDGNSDAAALAILSSSGRFTAVGNIVTGLLTANGNVLAEPLPADPWPNA